MSQEPEHLLQRAAARPGSGPDVAALRARAGRRRAVRRTGAALGVAGVLGLIGAGALTVGGLPGDDEVVLQQPPSPAPSPSATTPTATPSPTTPDRGPATPSPGAGFDGDAQPYERPARPGGEIAVLSEVRTGAHDGYDRVVWEFTQGTRPHLWVEYVDQPSQPGSGRPVDVAGDAYLRVTAGGARDVSAEHFMPDVPAYDGPERVDAPNAATIQEVVALGDFEANMQWAIGVDRERPFRVQVLHDPLRLVVDIANSGA